MKIALLPSNQTDNATAIGGVTESDLQLPIAQAAHEALSATGIESRVFHIPHVATSSGYPRFPQLHDMCRQAAAWGPDVVILNHSDACGSRPAGLLTLADYAIRDREGYAPWTKAYHAALGAAMGRPLKLWTYDQSYVGFRYGFYSYLANNGFHGWPLIVELANHESRADAEWLRDNPGPIGRALAASLMETLGLEGDDMYTDKDRERDAYTAVRVLATNFDVKILDAEFKGRPEWAEYYRKVKLRDVRNERIALGLLQGKPDTTEIPEPTSPF